LTNFTFTTTESPKSGPAFETIEVQMNDLDEDRFGLALHSTLAVTGLQVVRRTEEYRRVFKGVFVATCCVIAARVEFAEEFQSSAEVPAPHPVTQRVARPINDRAVLTLTFKATRVMARVDVDDAFRRLFEGFARTTLVEATDALRIALA